MSQRKPLFTSAFRNRPAAELDRVAGGDGIVAIEDDRNSPAGKRKSMRCETKGRHRAGKFRKARRCIWVK